MQDLSQALAEALYDIGAVAFSDEQPFIWASGIKSPIYCDNRLTLGYPELRNQIAAGFVEVINAIGGVELLAGTATAGIPHATLVADRLKLPLVYVRSKAKEHGQGRQIEGAYKKGQKVVVIEDLISTGGSSAKVVEALQAEGLEVLGVCAIFSYLLEAAAVRFEALGVPVYALSDLEALLEYADLYGKLRYSEIEDVREWQADPESWEPAGL